MNKITLRFIALIITVGCMTSCGGCQKKKNNNNQNHQQDNKKNSITIGISQEPDSLFIPFKEMMAAEEVVRAGLYNLTIFDENWKIRPWAAKEIPTLENGLLELFTENNIKKMRTTWHIKDEFYWSDGRPLTAEDFVFTHKLYKDKNQEVVDRTVVEKIESMKAMGENKKILVVTWKEPYAYYHNYRQHEAVPKHIVEPLYTQSPDQLKKSSFGQRPVLAGPYTIKEWVPGSHVVAQRNSHIGKDLNPVLDEIIWRIIPQTNTLESNLISNTIDAISPTGLSLDQALKFQERHGDRFDFHFREGLVWEHIDFNLDNPILKDVRVRQALAYGSDREGIAKALFFGRQPVAHGTEPPKSPYYNSGIQKYLYNPAQAKLLLDQVGWKINNKTKVREKDGQPLRLTIMTTSGNKSRERVEQFLQSQWKAIGIDIVIKNQPAKVFFGDTMRKRKFKHMAMYAWIKDPLALSDTLWRCDYIPSAKNNWQGQNNPGFCNPKADKLLKQGSKELDTNKRAQLGQEFEALFARELPSLPLFFRVEVSVTKKGLANWKPTGMLQPVSWNAHQWNWN